jgi:putative membrane protein
MMNEPRRDPHRAIRLIIGVLVVAILVVVLLSILFYPPGAYPFNEPNRFPYWILGFIFTILVIGFVLRLVFWVILGYPVGRYRRWERWYGPYGGGGDAEDILDQRYARGEITREQYQQMRDDLRRGGGPRV